MSAPLWEKKQYWVRFTVKSVSMCLLGRPQTLDWWENGGGFNASSSSPWYQNYPTCQHPAKYDHELKPWGEQNIYATLELPPNSFSGGGGNTICRMLALQKEIGVGRGWQMKMNGTVWSLGVCVWNRFRSFWSHRHAVMWLTPLQTSLFSPAVWIKTQLGPSMLFTYSEETAIFNVCTAVCRWRRQRLFFFFFFDEVYTTSHDSGGWQIGVHAQVLSCPIILNHKNRHFHFTAVFLGSARSAGDVQHGWFNPYFCYFMHPPKV